MRKLIITALILLLIVGCSQSAQTSDSTTTKPTNETTDSKLQVGVGSVTEWDEMNDASEKDGSAQANTTIAALVIKDGVIYDLDLDIAQNTGKFDSTGKNLTDPTTATPTKKELGDDYGMIVASSIKKEWYQQIEALEKYAVGKTVEEFLSTSLDSNEDLKTSVTLGIDNFLKAVENASKNLVEVENVASVGVASNTIIDNVSDAGEKNGTIRFNTAYALVALDADGKVVYVDIDNAQNTASFDATGKNTTDVNADNLTKTEKGDNYGMIVASTINKEWYEQMASFEEYIVGKTIEEVLATPTYVKDDEHQAVPDSEDLKTSVTIDIADYVFVVEKASKNTIEIQ